MSKTTPALAVRNLTCRLGGKEILHGIDLDVAPGEFVSLIGPNGAGKTTLLRCLNRIIETASGQVTIDGRDLDTYPQVELASQIAYVPQAEGRHFDFSVFEFVLLGRYPHLSPFSSISQKDRDVVHQSLVATGMETFAKRIHGTLSGGERQKVFIAAALAQEAPILLLDEPTTFLDPHHQEEILTILTRINRQDRRTVLSVTHDLNGAMLASNRIVALKDGQMVFSGTPEETMTERVLRTVYGASFLFADHPVTGQAMLVPAGGNA